MRFTAVVSIALFAQGIALALSGAAHAQQQMGSATLRVSAIVQAACSVTASDLNFGQDASRTGSGVAGATSVAVRCTPETAYNVALNAGTALDRRQMPAAAGQANYQLYQDPNRRSVWGNSIGSNTVLGEGTGQSVDHTLFGALPARRVIPAGEYGDTVTVQVYF